MLDGSSLLTIEGFEIDGRHRWQTGLQKGHTESTRFLVLFQLSTADARNDEVGSIVISAESEAPRSPAQHLVDHEESGRGGLRLWSSTFLSEILKKIRSQANRGPTPPQFRGVLTPPPRWPLPSGAIGM
jgi:hypothetical protein